MNGPMKTDPAQPLCSSALPLVATAWLGSTAEYRLRRAVPHSCYHSIRREQMVPLARSYRSIEEVAYNTEYPTVPCSTLQYATVPAKYAAVLLGTGLTGILHHLHVRLGAVVVQDQMLRRIAARR